MASVRGVRKVLSAFKLSLDSPTLIIVPWNNASCKRKERFKNLWFDKVKIYSKQVTFLWL